PTLKDITADNYYNWFLVKHQLTKDKSCKWDKYQPVLHPTTGDFEQRAIYINGDYVAKDSDEEAKNLIRLLQFDDPGLADKRKRYMKRKRDDMQIWDRMLPLSSLR